MEYCYGGRNSGVLLIPVLSTLLQKKHMKMENN